MEEKFSVEKKTVLTNIVFATTSSGPTTFEAWSGPNIGGSAVWTQSTHVKRV